MDATSAQLESLDRLQDLDRKRLQAQHALEHLPQRGQILALRKKRAGIEGKLAQIQKLYDDADAALGKLNAEDERVADKQKATQQKIDESKGDYRSVTSLTRDLEGMMKRRETLEFEMNKADKKLGEVGAVRTQAQDALNLINAKEQALVKSFRSEGTQLQEQIAQYEAARGDLRAAVPPTLLKAYDDAASICGGVGIAHLQENRCSACRSAIEQNRLLQLKRDAPIAVCPSCRRLLIID